MGDYRQVLGCITPFIKNSLPQQWVSIRDSYTAIGLHATISFIHVTTLYGSSHEDDKAVSFLAGWAIEPNIVTFVVACAAGQLVLMSFHPATGQLSVFVGTIFDVV